MKNILISQSIQYIKERNEVRDFLDNRLFDFLNLCNLSGIPVPNNQKNLKKITKNNIIHGIILSGGNDIYYSKTQNDLNLKRIILKRNQIEKELLQFALRKKIPILGICRGFQFINIYLKGQISPLKNHVKVKHKLNINRVIFKGKTFNNLIDSRVNSFHNFGIKADDLSKKLQCIAFSDVSIEAAINIKKKIIGIMWHPEREKNFSIKNIKLFKDFFNA